jgi:hypothetical protein
MGDADGLQPAIGEDRSIDGVVILTPHGEVDLFTIARGRWCPPTHVGNVGGRHRSEAGHPFGKGRNSRLPQA